MYRETIKMKEFLTETGKLIIKIEEEKENIKWMRYPWEFEAREIMLKSHSDNGSHLTIQKKLFKTSCKWDKMANDMRQMFYKWEFWIGTTKMPKKKIAYKHIKPIILKSVIKWTQLCYMIIYQLIIKIY